MERNKKTPNQKQPQVHWLPLCRSLLNYVIFPYAIVTLVFYFRMGLDILNPYNLGSIIAGDPEIGQVGWQFFRADAWRFPLTKMENFLYPEGGLILFTDSMPWLSIFVKWIAKDLPSSFQFFGLWLFSCFLLQFYIGEKIARLFVANKVQSMLIGLFFLITPAFLYRVGHAALTGHWLILFPIYIHLKLLLNEPARIKTNFRFRTWLGLTLLSVFSLGVHPYLMVMNFLFTIPMVFNQKINISNKVRTSWVGLYLSALVIAAWVLGYFLTQKVDSKYFSANSTDILSFFNSFGLSAVLPALRHRWGQGEGISYLGLGLIVALLVMFVRKIYLKLRIRLRISKAEITTARQTEVEAATLQINSDEDSTSRMTECLKSKKLSWLNLKSVWQRLPYKPLTVPTILFYLYAFSSEVAFGGNKLIDLKFLYNLIEPMPSIFRAAGRFSWPMTYLVEFLILMSVLKLIKTSRVKSFVLGLLLVIQFFDLLPWMLRNRPMARTLPIVGQFPQQLASRMELSQSLKAFGLKFKNKQDSQIDSGNPLSKKLESVTKIELVPHAYLAIEDHDNCPDHIWLKYYLAIAALFSDNYILTSGYAARTDYNRAKRCEKFWQELSPSALKEDRLYIVHPLYKDRFIKSVGQLDHCFDWGQLLVCLGDESNI